MVKVITISREYGSGGRLVGSLVAQKLGVPFYDRKIIEMSAEKSGLSENFVADNEQCVKNKFFHNLAFGYMNAHGAAGQLSLSDKLFLVTSEIITDLAEQGPCVIVGRCSDYVLRERDDVMNVFIYADAEHKKERAVKYYGMDAEKAIVEIARTDKYRANHYSYYTDRTWGDRNNYHLCLDSGFLGVERAADLIVAAAK